MTRGEANGVRVGFTISPGLTIEYSSERDIDTLISKLDAFVQIGARILCLALDDVSSRLVHESDRERFASLAHAHALLATTIHARLPSDTTLWLVPTDYAGTEVSTYLETLGREEPPKNVRVGNVSPDTEGAFSPCPERGRVTKTRDSQRTRWLTR